MSEEDRYEVADSRAHWLGLVGDSDSVVGREVR